MINSKLNSKFVTKIDIFIIIMINNQGFLHFLAKVKEAHNLRTNNIQIFTATGPSRSFPGYNSDPPKKHR